MPEKRASKKRIIGGVEYPAIPSRKIKIRKPVAKIGRTKAGATLRHKRNSQGTLWFKSPWNEK